MTRARPAATQAEPFLRSLAALAGLLALRAGCGLASAPLLLGGPMNPAFNVPLGVPLIILGVTGVAFAPRRWQVPAWVLAALVAFAPVGVAFAALLPGPEGLLHCSCSRRRRRSGPAWRRSFSRRRCCATARRWHSPPGSSPPRSSSR